MRENWVFIDYDDTIGGLEIDGKIVENRRAYYNAIDAFIFEYGWKVPEGVVRDFQNTIDHLLCDLHGFDSKSRFTDSFLLTFKALWGEEKLEEERERITELGMSVWNYPYRLLPNAREALSTIHKHYQVAIVTKGNQEEQSKKILDSGALQFSDRIWVVGHKNEDEWEQILWEWMDLSDEQLAKCWAIGNSPRGDVNIPVSKGMNGILVSKYGTWSFEEDDIAMPEQEGLEVHVVEDIIDTLNVLPLE